MIIETYRDFCKSKRGVKCLKLRCDECGKTFICNHCVKAALTHSEHYCSRQCVYTSKVVKAKILKSINIENIQSKVKNTCLERYGVTSYFKSEEFAEKRCLTLMKKFGVDHQSRSPEIVAKQQRGRGRIKVLKHWKTEQLLNCEASYELAFVQWANYHHIDFDWQIPHKMPDNRVYYIDAYIKDGIHTNMWIEIKGYMTPTGLEKWSWFHNEFTNSELWNRKRLLDLGIIVNNRCIPNPIYESKIESVS